MASKNNPIDPNPCGKAKENQNWTDVRDVFEQVYPKVGCATENWRMVGGVYPSHPSYPACPTLAQMCTVAVTHGGTNYTVKLPCQRNRDPNIETGDSVMFQQDFDKVAIYIGGHDDPIGTVKWWAGLPAEVPRGWKWKQGTPPAVHTRTGKWADAENKYVKNKFLIDVPGGTDPVYGTINQVCSTSGADITIADHDVFPVSVTVAEHPLTETSTEFTDITVTYDLTIEEAYTGITGYVDFSQHAHSVTPESIEIAQPGQSYLGTPITVASTAEVCTGPAEAIQCGSPVSNPAVYIEDPGHTHYSYLNIDLNDPGHFHAFGPLSHSASGTAGPLSHSATADNVKVPRVYLLLIERVNNAANASSGAVDAGVYCD